MEHQKPDNHMTLDFMSKSANESFARAAVAAFASQLDPTLEELADVKTAVSEAVTNAIIHGYDSNHDGMVHIECKIEGRTFSVKISDHGKGIENLSEAMTPLYTSAPDNERSGLGFTVMETFMDHIDVDSVPGVGTSVYLTKKFSK